MTYLLPSQCRRLPILAVLSLAGFLLPDVPSFADAPRRPNILFLFADDQRADTIGAWGNRHIQTPNLDRLVARGFSFRNNYCFGSNSGAVCVPSRAMLLTGRTWFDVSANLDGAKLLPELLHEHGYTVFATGKWHNGQPSFLRAFPRGRSVFFGGMNDHTRTLVADVQDGKVVNQRVAEKFSSEQFADAAIEFLQTHRSDKPFFCYVAFTAPHDPRNPPEKYRELYYRNRPPLPANFLPQHPFDNGMTKGVRDENLAPYPRTPEVIREQLCEYYGLITHLDEQVGRVLTALEKSGRAEDTVIIYSADHGLALGSHGLLGKQSLYEHSMKCPLIVAGPGIPAGRSSQAFTYLFDLFPTICDLAGITPPEKPAGESLRPIWTGEKKQLRDSVFLPFTGLMRSVRDERWKLIVYPPINHRQLFDLQNDPDEIRDLAGDPRYAGEIERLTGLMQSWQAKVGDRQPLTVAKPKPREISFEGYVRKPDQWQPEWIIKKYFRRPNVVLIVSDDHGYGDVGCYGKTDVDTPVIDELARKGVRFTRFRVNPLCAPTRASLLTGQYSLECGMWRGPSEQREDERALKREVRLLSQYLKEAGYATGIFGKWHLGYTAPNVPNERGFDEFFGFLGGAHRYDIRPKVGRLLHNDKPAEASGHTTDLFTSRAIDFIRRNKDRPFFCYVPYNAVHGPLWSGPGDRPSGKEEWLQKYEQRGIPFPRRDYAAVLSHMDDSIGQILRTLSELGLEEQTLVIFLSDNGAMTDKFPGNNGPLRGAKGTTYEGGIRVPCVVRWPGVIPAGWVSDQNAVHFDIFSTVLDAAGIPVPARNGTHPVHGVSLLPHLKSGGKVTLPDRYLFWDLFGKMAAVHGRWKLVGGIPNHHGKFAAAVPRIREAQFELYDLDADVGETRNLAAEQPVIYQDLKDRYLRWFIEATK
ncbi:MAG TPA: sulfatase-like hydrolase/transferase [Gemmataceae bacterium]|nr:sulfatase-like hydrolase/transferase [Gemmataceae bacterium]